MGHCMTAMYHSPLCPKDKLDLEDYLVATIVVVVLVIVVVAVVVVVVIVVVLYLSSL